MQDPTTSATTEAAKDAAAALAETSGKSTSEVQEIRASEKQDVTNPQDGDKHEEDSSSEEGQTQESETVTFDVDDVTRTEDGSFEWKPNPNDPKSMVYRGKTLKELFGNIAKNIADKDTYIGKLRSKQTLDPAIARNRKPASEDSPSTAQEEVVFPDYDEILGSNLRKAGIDGKYLRMTRDQWREHEQEHGAVETMELKQAIKEVTAQAQAHYESENVKALNTHSLYEETEAVTQILTESGIDADEFDYDAVLEKVYDNPKNFMKGGIRKSGRIVAEAAKEISKIVEKKVTEKVQTKSDEQIATARLRKTEVKETPKTKPGFVKPEVKKPLTVADALADVKRKYGIK